MRDAETVARRAILHVDMDAFFASVEERDQPQLRGKPLVVGGTPEGRGVVCAANYPARKFGIHSAMPAATAVRLCPHAVFLRPRHSHYAQVSAQIRAIFERYTPLVEPLSLDEAFLDVSGSLRLFGSAEHIGRSIKDDIARELNLVASVGVAPNKFLAKIASDVEKPDGFVVVSPEGISAFLDPLPVTRLWGVGKVTAKVFERLGLRTIGQMRAYPPRLLEQHLGRVSTHLLALSQGIDNRPVEPEQEAKSISHETTFARDIDDPEVLLAWLLDLTEQVGGRLRRYGLKGRTVHLKVRFSDFSLITRAQSLPQATDITADLWSVVRELFQQRLPAAHPAVRLVGMGVSGFGDDEHRQGDLFGAQERQHRSCLDQVADQIRGRYGRDALQRGAVAKKERSPNGN